MRTWGGGGGYTGGKTTTILSPVSPADSEGASTRILKVPENKKRIHHELRISIGFGAFHNAGDKKPKEAPWFDDGKENLHGL